MIIGDPDTFAIMFDVVNKWNDDKSFNEGLLLLMIKGKLFFSEIASMTLNVELPMLIESLGKPKINVELFNMNKNDAFNYLFKITFPEYDDEVVNDYSYFITPYEYADLGYFIFMVSNGVENRILASKLRYIREESTHDLTRKKVMEAYISNEELQEMVGQLNKINKEIRM